MACFLYPTGVYWLSALSSELFNLDFSCQTNSPSNCASNKATQNNTHSPIIICAYTLYIWVGESFACVVCECHKSEFSPKRNDWKVNIRENFIEQKAKWFSKAFLCRLTISIEISVKQIEYRYESERGYSEYPFETRCEWSKAAHTHHVIFAINSNLIMG